MSQNVRWLFSQLSQVSSHLYLWSRYLRNTLEFIRDQPEILSQGSQTVSRCLARIQRTHYTGTSSSRFYKRDQIRLPKKMEFNSQKYVKITPRTLRFISTGETFSFPFLLNSIYIYFHCTLESNFAPNHYYFYQVLDRLIFTSLNHVARALTWIKGLQQFHLLVQAASVSPPIKHSSISWFVVFCHCCDQLIQFMPYRLCWYQWTCSILYLQGLGCTVFQVFCGHP